MECIFCKSEKSNKKIEIYSEILNKTINYYRCKKCGSINQYPIPNEKEIKNYYESYFEIKKNMNPGYLETKQLDSFFEERNKTLKEIGFDINLLKETKNVELGCANGHFLLYLINQGAVDVTGIDISENLISSIKHKNVNLVVGDLLKMNEKSVDNLFLFNILEHIPYLEKTIDDINFIVKQFGNVIVEMPLSGIISNFFGNKWRFLMPDEHLHIPSLKGLKILFNRYNLEIIGITRFGSGFTKGMISDFFKNIIDKLAKKFMFGDRCAILLKKNCL